MNSERIRDHPLGPRTLADHTFASIGRPPLLHVFSPLLHLILLLLFLNRLFVFLTVLCSYSSLYRGVRDYPLM